MQHKKTHSNPPQTNQQAPANKKGSALLLVLLVAQLMVILDITAVNIALPSLAKDLQLSGSRSAGRSRATRSSSAACCSSAAAPPTCSDAAGCS